MKFHLTLALMTLIFLLLFQNCQNANNSNFDRNSLAANNNLTPQDSSATNSGTDHANSGIPGNINTPVALKVNLVSSPGAQLDCSRDDATMSQEIINAGADILICAEYKLGVSAKNKRYNEQYQCDTSTKFNLPDSSWVYNQQTRSWKSGVTRLRNNQHIVPGSYTLVVKDHIGQIYKSESAKVVRSGSDNCDAAIISPVRPPAVVPAPVAPPASPSPTPPSQSDGSLANCPMPSGHVKIKNLDWGQNTGNSIKENLNNTHIISFKITPSSERKGMFSTAFTGGSKATRTVVISTCPGELSRPVDGNLACVSTGFEVTSQSYSAAMGSAVTSSRECKLIVGKTYYINIKNVASPNSNIGSCETTNCPFFWRFR